MRWADVDPMVKEWCFARELMRRAGFGPDDLFFIINPSGKVIENGVAVELGSPVLLLRVTSGALEFILTIGPTDLPVADIETHFERACEIWNGTDIDMTEFRRSLAFRKRNEILMAMAAKGFARPGAN